MQPGEELDVSNGIEDGDYRCAIKSYDNDYVICDLLFYKENNVELPAKIYLFQGLPKADKMELIIQKSETSPCQLSLLAILLLLPLMLTAGRKPIWSYWAYLKRSV